MPSNLPFRCLITGCLRLVVNRSGPYDRCPKKVHQHHFIAALSLEPSVGPTVWGGQYGRTHCRMPCPAVPRRQCVSLDVQYWNSLCYNGPRSLCAALLPPTPSPLTPLTYTICQGTTHFVRRAGERMRCGGGSTMVLMRMRLMA